MEELLELISDPFLADKTTTDAFVGIVADFCDHFELQNEIVEGFSILNGSPPLGILTIGSALAHASRAPSLAVLASEEHAFITEDQLSGMFVSSPITGSPGRSPRISSDEPPNYFPVQSPIVQRRRYGSFDRDLKMPESPHRYQFRACSIAAFAGSPERVDGLPYLRFSTGQVLLRLTSLR